MQAGQAGGPFALALSARSNVLQEFEGGPGQIAIHGRDNLGGTLGAAESHGCVRLASASIDWLAARIGPGTPVRIYEGGPRRLLMRSAVRIPTSRRRMTKPAMRWWWDR